MKHNKYSSATNGTGGYGGDISGPTPGTGSLQSPAFDKVKQPIGPNTIPLKYNEKNPPKFRNNPVRNAMGTPQKQAAKATTTTAEIYKKNSMTSAVKKNVVKLSNK